MPEPASLSVSQKRASRVEEQDPQITAPPARAASGQLRAPGVSPDAATDTSKAEDCAPEHEQALKGAGAFSHEVPRLQREVDAASDATEGATDDVTRGANRPSLHSPPTGASQGTPTLGALFRAFLRVGLTAFGGPAMLPHVRRLVVDERRWLGEAAFSSGVAVCQAVPGATVMQVVAHCGLRLRGVPGMLVSFGGFALPACVMITALSALYWRNHEMPAFQHAFVGIKAVTLAIMVHGGLDFASRYLRTWYDRGIALAVAGLALLELHPLLPLGLAVATGLFVYREQDTPPPPAVRKAAPHATETSDAPAGPRSPEAPGFGKGARRLAGGLALTAIFLLALHVSAPRLYELAVSMMRTDLVAFGGALASLPVMRHEVVELRGWMTDAAFLDGIAIGQVTPGPIIMASAFIGWHVDMFAGAMIAAVSIFTPSLLMLLMADTLLSLVERSRLYRRGVRASLAALSGLLFSLIVAVVRTLPASPLPAVLAVGGFVALQRKVDPGIVVMVAAAISIATSLL